MEVFKIENLGFTYTLTGKRALEDVALTVHKGEFVVICGKSGCGKTTLLRHLKPTLMPKGEKCGEVFFEGVRVEEIDFRTESQKIGFVMQNTETQIVCDKVWKELAFGLENLGMSTSDIRIRVAEISAFFGLEEIFHTDVFKLSGGQKQLLNLASVMVMDPEVLVLDEPTSQLDPIAAQKFLDAVVKINRDLGVTVVISEHNLEGVLEFSDRVIAMEDGCIVSDSKPEKIADAARAAGLTDGLPIAMRIFAKMGGIDSGPISVRDGRIWLAERLNKESALPLKKYEKDIPIRHPGICLENIWYRYERDSEYVLRGFSAKIQKGEIYSIVGGNAAGKSTLLKIATGVLKPERGKITVVEGQNHIGMVPQNPRNLFVEKTLIDDFERIEVDNGKIDEVTRLCELETLMGNHPFDLSGGELQRAAIAKILLGAPEVLFLDEPTKGMDAAFKNKFKGFLKNLKSTGMTIVLVSHDLDFCAEVSDRCGMLFDGQNLCEGEPGQFFTDKRFYTTSANRMAKGIIPGAVTAEDILVVLRKREEKENEED